MMPREIPVVQGSDAWKGERAGRMTSTKNAEACGLSLYGTPQSCAARMIRERRGEPEEEEEERPDPRKEANMAEGHRKEPIIARDACRLLGYEGYREAGIFIDARDERMADSPDRILTDPFLGGALVPVECKNSIWSLAAEPKLEHLVQCTHHMRVLRAPYCLLAYGHGERSVRVFRVHYSHALWAWIQARLDTFWRCVEAEDAALAGVLIPVVRDMAARTWYGLPLTDEQIDALPAAPGHLPPAPAWVVLAESVDPREWTPSSWNEWFDKRRKKNKQK
jgi:hypothetical protein